MEKRSKILLILPVFICAVVILYFIPVDIALKGEKPLTQKNSESLTVLVSDTNIFKIAISNAEVDEALIEPENIASAEKSDQRGIININFRDRGDGKLIVKSAGHIRELIFSSTIPATPPPKTAKPVSKLRTLYDKYKHVEKIYLHDGTIMLGVMYEKPAGIDFITPDGTLKLTKDDIVRVVYLKPDGL